MRIHYYIVLYYYFIIVLYYHFSLLFKRELMISGNVRYGVDDASRH